MKKLSKDLLNWIKNPDDISLNIEFKEKVNLLFRILGIDILIGAVFWGLAYLIDLHVVKLEESLLNVNAILLFLYVVLIMPTIEEIVFRLPLKYKRNYLVRGLNYLFGGKIKEGWDRSFKYFVYFMALFFGLYHLTNFENNEVLFYCLGPIIVGSQIVGGFTLSYTRIKLGFGWSIVQHGMFNLCGVVIGIMFFHNSNIINVDNNEYTFRVTELMYTDNESSSYSKNIQNGIIYSIKGEDINLQRVINSLTYGESLYHDTWVDFYFESEKGIPNNTLLELLKNEFKFDELQDQAKEK